MDRECFLWDIFANSSLKERDGFAVGWVRWVDEQGETGFVVEEEFWKVGEGWCGVKWREGGGGLGSSLAFTRLFDSNSLVSGR